MADTEYFCRNAIRVVIVYRDFLFGQLLREFFEIYPDIEVEFTTYSLSTISFIQNAKPDVVVVDEDLQFIKNFDLLAWTVRRPKFLFLCSAQYTKDAMLISQPIIKPANLDYLIRIIREVC